MITKQEVLHLASLARIKLLPNEAEDFAKEIDSILDYVGQIKEVSGDLKKEKPLLRNVMRDDIVVHKPGEFSEKILSNAPQREGNYFKVKKIL